MPPVHVCCSQLLCLDLDGVVHKASDSIHLSQSGRPVPGPILAVQLRAQRRLVWLPLLEEILALNPGVAILVHSTWRRRFDAETIAELLGPLCNRVIKPPAYQVDLLAPAPEFIRSSLDWLNAERAGAQVAPITMADLLVLDDRSEFFKDDEDLKGRLLLTNPDLGLSDPVLRGNLRRWVTARDGFHHADFDDHGEEQTEAAPAPAPNRSR